MAESIAPDMETEILSLLNRLAELNGLNLEEELASLASESALRETEADDLLRARLWLHRKSFRTDHN